MNEAEKRDLVLEANPEQPTIASRLQSKAMTRDFSVAVLVKEDMELIRVFAAYYVGLGAQEVMIFYDGVPDFPSPSFGPNVSFVQCDDTFWATQIESKGAILEERQSAIYRHAQARCTSEWMLIVDCDELLMCDAPVAELLRTVPHSVDILRVPNVEAVCLSDQEEDANFGALGFRRPAQGRLNRKVLKLVYGQDVRFLGKGLAGHSAGKQFLRSRAQFEEIGLHDSTTLDKQIGRWITEFSQTQTLIAHFDAVSFDQWVRKFTRRHQMGKTVAHMRATRSQLVDVIADTAQLSSDDLRGRYRRLYRLSGFQYALLRLFGLAFKRNVFGEPDGKL